MKKLVLFDIDGTLIYTGGAGTRSLDNAFLQLFGIKDAFKDFSMAGKTDKQIIREGLKLHGLPSLDGNIDALIKGYLQNLREEIHNPRRRFQPGIKETLAMLKERKTPLGLLTGNLEEGARIKLEPFGLNEYFLDGAFGSDHEDRNMLLPIAINKFSKKGFDFSPLDCVIVGDTPRDVQCAKIHNAHCIAVATGPYPREVLMKTEADIVVNTLAEIDIFKEFFSGL